MSDKNIVKFENPQKLPLDKLYLKVYNRYGARDMKAIDPFWIPEIGTYPKYYPLKNDGDMHNWIHKNTNYLKVLKMFYNSTFQEFWSIILYEPSFSPVLESFLDNSIPPFLSQPQNEHIATLYSDIYSIVFAIYKRLLMCRNSETEYMNPKTISTFLFDNNVVKIETVVQLVKLYGCSDDYDQVYELITTIFELIPQLNDHLEILASNFYDILEKITSEAYDKQNQTVFTTEKLCQLLFETTFSLKMLLQVYEPFKKICIENGLVSRLVFSYDEEIPLVDQLVEMIIFEGTSEAAEFLKNAKIEILEICHILLCTNFDLLLSQDTKWLSLFLDNIETISKSPKFAAYYDSIYPLHPQLEMLKMIFPDYLYNNDRYERLTFVFEPEDLDDQNIKIDDFHDDENINTNYDNFYDKNEEISDSKNDILDSKIKEILEILPYFGDGFIEMCLRHFHLNTEYVIEAILNREKLPPELSEIDTKLPRIPPEEDEEKEEKPILKYQGKKPEKNFNELFNDKSEIAGQKERYRVYENEEWYDSLYNDDVESDVDEYVTPLYEGEDILDSLPKKRTRNNSDGEGEEKNKPGTSRNSKSKPQNHSKNSRFPLNLHKSSNADEENSNSDEEPEFGSQNPRPKDPNAFCEDPALIRARREASYQSKNRQRSSRDVTGNPKGQGQEKNVQMNRENKNKNKSSRANHNRRSGAQWKRSRGMVPS